MFKRRRRCIVHDNTVIDRPRGFAIEARTKFPRRGKKGMWPMWPLNVNK